MPSIVFHAAEHLRNTLNTLAPNQYPITTTASGAWNTVAAGGWTSGFFPGTFWLLHDITGDPFWKLQARRWQTGLRSQQYNRGTHDLGFMMFSSFGNDVRLTGNPDARRVVLQSARSLASRYSSRVGALRSWDGPPGSFRVIIDNMMNLELLLWASKNGGSSQFRDIAIAHARTTARDFFRPDGTTFHVVVYDPATGRVKEKTTAQGYAPSSTWSRGQAWAIHGFTTLYRETRDPLFLVTARRAADAFIVRLPSDGIPPWDFNAPKESRNMKDSSAAAIAASGLLELSRLETDVKRSASYFIQAETILSTLSSGAYRAPTGYASILLHGTYNKRAGDADTGTIWGDYYFLESFLRYRQIAKVR
jgi:unsaturated chondroitin disaccharide hydrolase